MKNYLDLERGFASLMLDRYFDVLTILVLSTTGLIFLGYKGILEGESLIYILLFLSGVSLVFLTGTLVLWTKRKKVITLALDESIDKIKKPKGMLFFGCCMTFLAWTAHALRVSLIIHSVGSSMPFPW